MAEAYVNNQLTTDANARGGKYEVEAYTYPMDLFGSASKYANAWTMININVQDKSSALNSVEGDPIWGQTIDLDAAEKNRFKPTNERPKDIVDAMAAAGAATGFAGATLKASINNPVESATNIVSGTIKGAAIGALASVPFAKLGIKERATKRLKAAIQLPMPQTVQSGYNMRWSEGETKMFDMMSKVGKLGPDGVNTLMGKGDGSSLDAATGFVLSGANIAGAEAISAYTGLAANPKKEQIFESVGFRTFTMEYRFYPRSQAEMGRLNNIIYLLKYHMHPEFLTGSSASGMNGSSGQFTFIYPSEFDITFYTKQGSENPWINKIATCVLTDFNVNYTPDAFWVGHEDGSPNGIQLSLTFREISILTKDQVKGGF